MQTETKKIQNFIGGELADPADGRLYDLVNPSTGEVFAQAPASGKEDVDQAFDAAEKAFETWRDSTPSERQLALLKLADAIEERGRAMRVSRRLDFGCVWINTHIPLVAEMPHGGFKHSGQGKDLSMYGLEDYTRIKHVMTNLEA